MPRKPRAKNKGKWVFVPDTSRPSEEVECEKMDDVCTMLSLGWDSSHPFAAVDQFQDYFPGNNQLPDGSKEGETAGAWILVKTSPPTEYTVPPMSIWFAEPWPMERERHSSNRVKIVTPQGELGLFPREYSRLSNPEKFYEFIGDGMQIKFFGDIDDRVLPADALFYLRSRGISKKDAIILLIGSIKAHGVLWMETDKEIAMQLCNDWPDEKRLATA